ncbi:GNAT family N-acetyltransferase [Pseudolysinimonas sp.]|uniref:GNAT family N-acetyltransferase n=1 Tax=Pseudolysinimonas sp. TaxID=2680009 RepID=UPI003F801D77
MTVAPARVVLRPAADDDLDAIVGVFLACWGGSYAEVMPAGLVARMTPASARELWARTLAGPTEVVVAVAAEVLGVVGFRLEEDGGYVASLYVAPAAQGTGAGGALLAEAERRLAELGAHRATLWVFEANEPSRVFYERRGWRLTGEREVQEEWGEPQLRMAKELAAGHR